MKKDLDKIYSRTLLTYFTVLFVVFVLKMFGLNYFGLDTENEIINGINNFVSYWRLENVWFTFTLYINAYIVFAITCNDNSKKMKLFTLLTIPIHIFIDIMKEYMDGSPVMVIIDLIYLFILAMCYIKFVKRDKIYKYNVGNYWLFMLSSTIFQLISLITRNMIIEIPGGFIINTVISLDYLVLSMMLYKLYFIKGGKSLCVQVHSYSLVLLTSLRTLPTRFLQSYQSSKPETKQDELANKIYVVLFWLYNFFTLAVILLIGGLNHTFIECIFILSSFWINKGVFGKAFHLSKASTCFIVSSLSYYALNRLTWKIGISFLVPLLLGMSLAYVTSKLMARKENLYLYRGMPKEDFYELISKVTSNEEHIEICKMYYVDKETNVKISMKFNYSEINIKKIKGKINKKIKELYR